MYVIMRKSDGLFYRRLRYRQDWGPFERATLWKQHPNRMAANLCYERDDWRLRDDVRQSQQKFRFLNSFEVKKVKVELDNGQ